MSQDTVFGRTLPIRTQPQSGRTLVGMSTLKRDEYVRIVLSDEGFVPEEALREAREWRHDGFVEHVGNETKNPEHYCIVKPISARIRTNEDHPHITLSARFLQCP